MVETCSEIEIANIVGVLDFHRELDLSAVSNLLRSSEPVTEVEYSPEKNHWLQSRFRFSDSSKYVSFYKSGTCSIVGCDSPDQLTNLVDLIIDVMDPVVQDEPTLEIKNLVCLAEYGTEFNLSQLAVAIGLERVEYEPEQFSGLIYRDNKTAAVFLVFSSGKIIITGEDDLQAADRSYRRFKQGLNNWISSA